MRNRALLPFLIGSLMSVTPVAQAAPQPERAAMLTAARGPAEAEVGRPVRFVVHRLATEGRWAFVFAAMQDAHGRRVDWRGTEKAEAAARGLVSDDYAALLWRGDDRRWTVVAHAAGPTDAAWAEWPAAYGAPASLFGR